MEVCEEDGEQEQGEMVKLDAEKDRGDDGLTLMPTRSRERRCATAAAAARAAALGATATPKSWRNRAWRSWKLEAGSSRGICNYAVAK